MPTYYFWIASLVLHAVFLSLVVPDIRPADVPAVARALTARFVPAPRPREIPPPPETTSRLPAIQSNPPEPRVATRPVAAATAPRTLAATTPTPRWGQLLPAGLSLAAPQLTVGPGTGESRRASGDSSESDGPPAMPSYGHTPLPAYPRLAKLNGWQGVAVLRVEVLPDGRVGRVELMRSSGHDLLDETALKAVQDWRFEPARRGAVAVPCFIEVPIRFKLTDRDV